MTRTYGKKATQPCLCQGDGRADQCTCSPEKLRQYQQRVSGPLLDRIDLHVTVPRLNEQDKAALLNRVADTKMSSAVLRERVLATRALQHQRAGKLNAQLAQSDLQASCPLSKADERLLTDAMTRLRLSTRAYFRVVKIARTIADLAGESKIGTAHLLEAINYRRTSEA